MATRTVWVLGGGGARGAAQVGVLLGLLEAGVEPPSALVGTSVGSLNGATMAAYPSLAGAMMLREIWLSNLAREVLQVNPLSVVMARLRGQLSVLTGDPIQRLVARTVAMTGTDNFEHLKVPLQVVATDIRSGHRKVFSSGPLGPALLASSAIPGVFPAVRIEGCDYLDGGIVDNTPVTVAADGGAQDVVAISLMAPSELPAAPATWDHLIARTLQLSLHHRLLADFRLLRERIRLTVICPITGPTAAWDMRRPHVESTIEKARLAVGRLISEQGSKLFRRSALHMLDLD
jgi:NTE family protein